MPKKNRLHPLRVRPFRPADEKDCIRMGMRAFSGPGTEDRWRHYLRGNPHLSAGRVLVATRGSARVGMAALLDFRMAVEGRMVPMDGVAAVGVDSLSRQQGVADALLREAIRCSARMRRPLSTLHPFRESFYRKFGYALFEWVQVLTIPPRALPHSVERENVRFAKTADRPKMARCYREWARARTGPLERTPYWWKRRVLAVEPDEIVYLGPRGAVEGYSLGAMVDRGVLGRRRYRVLETVWTTDRARRGLLGALRSMGDEVGLLELPLAQDDPMIAFLRDPALLTPALEANGQGPSIQLGAGCMARITDLDEALLLRHGRGERGVLRIELRDPHLPANEKPRTIRLGAKGPELLRSARDASPVRAEVGAFTQVLLGAVPATTARQLGQLECDLATAQTLDRAWHGPAAFLSPPNRF